MILLILFSIDIIVKIKHQEMTIIIASDL